MEALAAVRRGAELGDPTMARSLDSLEGRQLPHVQLFALGQGAGLCKLPLPYLKKTSDRRLCWYLLDTGVSPAWPRHPADRTLKRAVGI